MKRADLNADGKEDYVLDGGSVGCEGIASLYGDREKGVTVYVGDGTGGAKQAFSDMTYGMKSRAKVRPQRSGRRRAARAAARSKRRISPARRSASAIAWNAKSHAFDYAPVSTVKMIE